MRNPNHSGFFISTNRPPQLYYVVKKQDTGIVAIVTARPTEKPLAERLVANLGREEGLLSYPVFTHRLNRLPVEIPGFTPPLELELMNFRIPPFGPFFQGDDIMDRLSGSSSLKKR